MFQRACSKILSSTRPGVRALRSAQLPRQQSTLRRSRSPTWIGWSSGAALLLGACLVSAGPLALEAERPVGKAKELAIISGEEVQKHVSPGSAWVVIDGVVLDVSSFLFKHPAGAEAILEHLGKDISALFNLLHASDVLPKILPQLTVVGLLSTDANIEIVGTSDEADEIEERRDALPDPEYVINLGEFEKLAKEVLGPDSRAWRFFSSYADDGASYNSTRSSFSFLRFLPRINVPVVNITTFTTFLCLPTSIPIPLFMSPTGASANGHPDGELNLTRAASITGIPQIVSTMSSISISDLAAERDRLEGLEGRVRAPIWWQLYVMTDRRESERRIRKAVEAGAEAIVITVDVAAIGKREADARVVVAKGGKGGAKPGGGVAASGSKLFDADMTWADIDWVKKFAPGLPILIKGIACVADVELAKKHGASGVILSNHGGRQLDFSPPPLATLVRLRRSRPELLEDPKFDVFIDGGVTRGTDVLKALCLGAKGVGLGRTMLYAQTCYGDAGVIRATEILTQEIQSGMRLLGARSIKELRPEMLELLDGLVGEQLK